MTLWRKMPVPSMSHIFNRRRFFCQTVAAGALAAVFPRRLSSRAEQAQWGT